MPTERPGETRDRLLDWTAGQGPSERLSAQILHHEGYEAIDPSHPLGGPDGGKDARCRRKDETWIMAAHFPRGQQAFAAVRKKFNSDLAGVVANSAVGIAFVTNQELAVGQRAELARDAAPSKVDIFHLERLAGILDRPEMEQVRRQFLRVGDERSIVVTGGEGGRAPGAGGGGGGALGDGAQAGPGGPGGSFRDLGELTLHQVLGRDAQRPGAGGGAAPACGPGAVGGGGGGGGDAVQFVVRGPFPPGTSIPLRVGQGGRGGERGEDTVFGDLVAKGGVAGEPALGPVASTPTVAIELKPGLSICAALWTTAAEVHNGQAFALGCCCTHAVAKQFPWTVHGTFLLVFELRDVIQLEKHDFEFEIVDPAGRVGYATKVSVWMPRQEVSCLMRIPLAIPYAVHVTAPGRALARLVRDGQEFMKSALNVVDGRAQVPAGGSS